MTITRNESDRRESKRTARAVLPAVAAVRDRNVEKMAAMNALRHFPHHFQRVIVGLEQAGLLPTTEIDYVDGHLRRVDFAWPVKMIGLRVTMWPLGAGTFAAIPDFVYNDAALRELGWQILYIDPHSSNFEAHLARAVSMVTRVGAYRGPGK